MAKVFGIGTSSERAEHLARCLQVLGYRHCPHDPMLVDRVLVGNDLEALDTAACSYDSFAGEPWALYYRRLDRLFPEARFVLDIERPSRSWIDSLRRGTRSTNGGHGVATAGPNQRPGHDGKAERHVRQVQEYFAGRPDKLLVVCWAVDRSWQRLADFLGQPVPQQPLPKLEGKGRKGLSVSFRRIFGAHCPR